MDIARGALLRGGNWNNGTNTGVFTANLNNDPSNTNTNIGFRCVFRPARLRNCISRAGNSRLRLWVTTKTKALRPGTRAGLLGGITSQERSKLSYFLFRKRIPSEKRYT